MRTQRFKVGKDHALFIRGPGYSIYAEPCSDTTTAPILHTRFTEGIDVIERDPQGITLKTREDVYISLRRTTGETLSGKRRQFIEVNVSKEEITVSNRYRPDAKREALESIR